MFIIIEGVDGSGKATQTALLTQHLEQDGHSVSSLSFPRYGHPSAWFVQQFLNGEFGPLDQVDPQLASVLYTLDRYGAKKDLTHMIDTHDYVVSDRYSVSSFIHRGTSYLEHDDYEGMRQFFDRLYEREFVKAGLPLPDLIIYLDLSETSLRALSHAKQQERRAQPWYVDSTHDGLDLAEQDVRHQLASRRVWREILPDYFGSRVPYQIISCDDESGQLLSREQIHERVYEVVHRTHAMVRVSAGSTK